MWGKTFLDLPETRNISRLFEKAKRGLKILDASKTSLHHLIETLENGRRFMRILNLFECIEILAKNTDYLQLSTQEIKHLNTKDRERIDHVFQFTMDNFRSPIQLEQVAEIAAMSIPAFCNYFKRSTRKKYIDF